ncbi:MAG TPA: VOC family protein, partial [Bacteroidota bacterium]|nr:VOC family protein [Bacteroidota bacterium]
MTISTTHRFRRVAATLTLLCAFVTLSTVVAQTQISAARFEHIAINVANPHDVAKWYTENLGFTVERQGAAPGYSTMIVDSTRNLAIEIYHNAEHPLLEPVK